MALKLNLTLVVQMAHFLIAYFLITKFLLKQGYAAVKSDAEKIRQLRGLIIGEQQKLAEKQEHKRKRWHICQNYFYQNRPDLEGVEGGIRSFGTIEPATPLTREQLTKQVQEISKKLKQRVIHG